MSRRAQSQSPARPSWWKVGEGRIWLAAMVLAPIVGALVGRWPTLSVAACAVATLLLGVALSREFALGAILVTALVMLGVSSVLGLPGIVMLLTKGLIGLYALSVMVDINHDNPLRVPTTFIAFVGVIVISAAFGGASRFHAAQALGAYFAAMVAYLAVVHSDLALDSLKRITVLVLAIIAVQVPIMVLQSRYVASVDDIGGTFGTGGSTQILAVMFGAAWTIAIALLTGRRRIWLLPIGFALAAALLISQSKAGFVFAAAGTIVVGLAKALLNPRRGILVVAQYAAVGAGTIAVLLGAYVYLGPYLPGGRAMSDYWIAFLTNPTTIMDYLFSYDVQGQAGRLEGTRLVLVQSRTLANLLIGQGPGLLSGSALLGQDSATSSSMGYTLNWATSATRWLLEVGLLGIGLYLAAIATAVISVARTWAARHDELGRSVAAAAVGLAAVYCSAALFTSPWTTDAMAVPFWCLLGIALKWGRFASPAEKDAVPSEALKRDRGGERTPGATPSGVTAGESR